MPREFLLAALAGIPALAACGPAELNVGDRQTAIAACRNAICRHNVVEFTLRADKTTDRFADAPTARLLFEHSSGTRKTIPAFWDGGNTFRVRFAPAKSGSWTYRVTSSNDEGLKNHSGSFSVRSEMGGLNNRGRIEVDSQNRRKFRYSDGSPFFWLGHSIDWDKQASFPSQYRNIVRDRASKGFTVLVGYSGPGLNKKLYAPNGKGPPVHDKDLDRINHRYFQEVDERLKMAIDNGMTVTMALSFADQGIWNLNRSKLERLWKYVIARYAAYPTFWQPVGEYEDGSANRAKKLGALTRREDPYDNLLSMHSTRTSAELSGQSWFDFIIHQRSGGKQQCTINGQCCMICGGDEDSAIRSEVNLIRSEHRYQIPIIQQEYRAADPGPTRVAAWRHVTNGAYYTLTAANFKVPSTRAKELGHLNKFFMDVVGTSTFQSMTPHSKKDVLTDGSSYIVYAPDGGDIAIDNIASTHGRTFAVTWFNPRTGATATSGNAESGRKDLLTPPYSGDVALFLKSRDTGSSSSSSSGSASSSSSSSGGSRGSSTSGTGKLIGH